MDAHVRQEKLEAAMPMLEKEHRRWRRLLVALSLAVKLRRGHTVVARALDEFWEYSQKHFRYEERFLKEIGYPQLEEQVRQHAYFTNWVSEARKDLGRGDDKALANDVLEMMRTWMVKHIQEADGKYVKYCAELLQKR